MRRANGFTLIELLVALVAGSLLMVSLSWALSLLTHQLSISKDDRRAAQLASLAPVLVHLLEQAQPPGPDNGRFQGDAKRLAAVTSPPEAAGPVGSVRLILTVRPSGDGEGLFASRSPVEPDPRFPRAAGEERLLIDGYQDISFAYLEPIESQVPRLPRSITVSLTDVDGRIQRIVAEPRIDSDGSCHFDPISMTCRA